MKIIFSDLDGTLLNSQHFVSNKTKSVIQNLSIPFIIASARMPKAIWPIVQALDLKMPIIAYGGGLIIDADQKTIIHEQTLDQRHVNLVDMIETDYPDIAINLYHRDNWIVSNDSHPLIVKETMITKTMPQVDDVKAYILHHSIHKILCIGRQKDIRDLHQVLLSRNDCQVILSKPTYLEIIPLSVSKGHALKVTCEYFNIDVASSVAFGDQYNDLSMIKDAGIGIAMKQAPIEVRQEATYVALSNDEDGVATMIEQLRNEVTL